MMPIHREFIIRHRDDMSPAEIAKRLNEDVERVKEVIRNYRKKEDGDNGDNPDEALARTR